MNNLRLISYSGTFRTKRLNFCRISHLGTFPPKRPKFAIRDVSDETAESIPPNSALGMIPTITVEFLPNFALRDVSPETAESIPPNFTVGTFLPKRPNQSRRISIIYI
ncbi:MAG: hypothetical protein Q8881_04190 [Sweet potato little leaf phytoplasma]|nr:hypothetical protein [Sweet potato little leaf phytoplasma]